MRRQQRLQQQRTAERRAAHDEYVRLMMAKHQAKPAAPTPTPTPTSKPGPVAGGEK